MPDHLCVQVETCYKQAEAFFGRPFFRPEISFQLKGQKAGVAHLDENRLRFNLQMYQENRDDFLIQTVAHEVAHLVAHQLFGPSIRPHGEEWQLIMRGVYELEPDRCHSYKIPQRQAKHYVYRCKCQHDHDFPFTARRHHLARDGRRYICRRCQKTLHFTGETCLA